MFTFSTIKKKIILFSKFQCLRHTFLFVLIPIRWTVKLWTNCSGSCIRSSPLYMLVMNKFVCKFCLSFAHTNCIRMSVDWVNLLAKVVIKSLQENFNKLPITFVNSITLPAAAVANAIATTRHNNPTTIPPGEPSNWLKAVKLFVGFCF